jgi:Sep-tRNA:Cys-tRNA synthetase
LLSVTSEWEDRVFAKSRQYKVKPLEILGCSTRGSSTIALMAGYPRIKERVNEWEKEVEKSRDLIKQLEALGLNRLGLKPVEHDLSFIESDVLYEISKTHKKKNYYLYSELKKRGVVGIKSGLTKNFKLSTYGITKQQVKHISWAFADIINKFGK